jgi:MFS transporter, NNP family, nitrate/nitrite transporter
VALTIPARIIVGMALDRWGPRRVFSVLMVTMAVPTLFFAFGTTAMQLFIARLVMSSVGASFVVGIHMTALWFKPRDIGFAEGFYAGWGNFGSAAAAMTIPTVALVLFGGDDGWRWAVATSGVIMAPTASSTGSPSPTARRRTPTASRARPWRWKSRATAT